MKGRNAPCPCGSGKKFKKCCLEQIGEAQNAAKVVLHPPDSIASNVNQFALSDPDFNVRRKQPVQQARRSFEKGLSKMVLDAPSQGPAILDYIRCLEESSASILRNRSWHYWLMLSRRIFPDPSAYPSSRLSTAKSARDTLTALILKHGRREVLDVTVSDKKELIPKKITFDDVLGIYQADFLAYELALSGAAYRRLGKGGKIVDRRDHWTVELTPDREALVQLLDTRIERYIGGLAGFGLPQGKSDDFISAIRSLLNWDSKQLLALVAVYNFAREEVTVTWEGPERKRILIPNFLILPLNLEPLFQVLCNFRAEFSMATGLNPEQVVAFLVALTGTHLLEASINPYFFTNVMITGYRTMESSYVGALAARYGQVLRDRFGLTSDEAGNLDDVQKLITFFAVQPSMDASSSPVFSAPSSFVIRGESRIVFDLSLMAQAISGLPMRIGETGGDIGKRRGGLAEQEIFTWINKQITKATPHWPLGYKAYDRSGQLIKEIDGAYKKNRTLFILEVKAPRLPSDYWWGHRTSVEQRESLLLEYLARHDSQCQRIAEADRDLEGIEEIVPIVCTPFPEYVSLRKDLHGRDIFLTNYLPRVCTPGEVVWMLEQDEPSLHLSRSCALRVGTR